MALKKASSSDLEITLKNMLDGLTKDVDILKVDDEKLQQLVKSRQESFLSIKEMLGLWQNSPNAPKEEKLIYYTEKLILGGEKSSHILRQALIKKIDFTELDPEKYGLAMKSKPIVYKAISEINSGVNILKRQIETNTLSFKEQEFKPGMAERYANQEFFPTSNYYKNWYDEDNDAIILDPKGTKGEMIILDNLKIWLPEPPTNKKKILFSDLPKEEQYWRRLDVPNGLTPSNEEEYTDYILEEFRRRREGCWFMNNGIPTWVTGAHYMGLQWNEMIETGGYKEFRKAQCNLYYFALATMLDERCVGMIFCKGRRSGFTEMALDHFVDKSTSVKNRKFGITSKTEDDAEVAFLKYSHTIQNLPFFFRPVVQGKIDDKKKMLFGKPSDNTKTAKQKNDTSTKDYLNVLVDYRATATLAYDSIAMYMYLGDECFGKGTKILMSDFTFKNIEDIKIGEFVKVEGGKDIEVLDTVYGQDNLYKIKQPYNKDYIVNSKHKLYLEKGNGKNRKQTLIITPKEYLDLGGFQKRITTRVYSKGFDFKEKELKIDPYILGFWLGDGKSSSSEITVNDLDINDVMPCFEQFAKKHYSKISIYKKGEAKCKQIAFQNIKKEFPNQYSGSKKIIKNLLLEIGVLNNKHIPNDYMFSSREQRLELLAGIIDSDGYNSGKQYNIGMARKELVEQIYHLCKGLGFDVSEIKHKKTNFQTDSYNIAIQKSSEIKCKVKRKQTEISTTYSSRRIKIDVEECGFGEYYGITLNSEGNDENRKLILEDYTITLNCGKWIRPNNYIDHWTNVKPTMIQGGTVVGKALLGSTLNPLDKGGEEFQTLYIGSDITKRDSNQETSTGLYSYFLPAHQNYERFTDKYGVCHESLQKGQSFINSKGKEQTQGALQYLEAKFLSAKKMGAKAYNNTRRLDPITIEDAFRDELQSQLFDIEKINSQLNFNRKFQIENTLVRGNFEWKDGIKDSSVVWKPKENGRFLISWIPAQELNITNRFVMKSVFGVMTKCPVNDQLGAFGCDPYDQSAVVDSKLINTENGVEHNLGSKGALHGYLGTNIGEIPSQQFFLEYIARPKDADAFFEDMLMACFFYSMPILVENNKKMLLKHFKVRGYRGFALSRFDKDASRLSQDEKELGGIPNSSEDIKNQHWTSIEKYVNDYVGEYYPEPGEIEIRTIGAMGVMPFSRTLSDWLKFNINKRTDFDASISSGLALMAVNRHKYKPVFERKPVTITLKRFS